MSAENRQSHHRGLAQTPFTFCSALFLAPLQSFETDAHSTKAIWPFTDIMTRAWAGAFRCEFSSLKITYGYFDLALISNPPPYVSTTDMGLKCLPAEIHPN